MPAEYFLRFRRIIQLTCLTTFLTACAATPVYIAELGTREFARHEDLKGKLSNAIIDEEGDMLTVSVGAVIKGKTKEAEELYLQGYKNPRFGPEIKAIALHQIAMIYKSSYNVDRDYNKALNYLHKIVNELPETRGANYARLQIKQVEALKTSPITLTPAEKLTEWERTAVNQQEKYNLLDQDMNPLSRRAVIKQRIPEALELYTLVYNETGMPDDFRATALYQKALILLNQDTVSPNDRHTALLTLRQIISEFPDTRYRKGVERHLNALLNKDKGTLKQG